MKEYIILKMKLFFLFYFFNAFRFMAIQSKHIRRNLVEIISCNYPEYLCLFSNLSFACMIRF